jgi:hypothetical protein
MSIQGEYSYHEGFIDGEQTILDIWEECKETTDSWTEACEEFDRKMKELQQDIDSL